MQEQVKTEMAMLTKTQVHLEEVTMRLNQSERRDMTYTLPEMITECRFEQQTCSAR